MGNLLGAIRIWARDQHEDSFHLIVDLHALTLPKDPAELRSNTLKLAMTLIAAAGVERDDAFSCRAQNVVGEKRTTQHPANAGR